MNASDYRYRALALGLGGGGCQAFRHLAGTWRDAPELAVAHTDLRSLRDHPVTRRLPLGETLTGGLSSGGDPEVGRRAAEASADALRAQFEGLDLLFLVVGLGGGTGSGAAPVICRLARDMGALTLVYATLPFFFEGPQRRRTAETALRALRGAADAVIALPNERLTEWLTPDTPISAAFRKTDEALDFGVGALWQTLAHPGLLPLDMSHLRALARGAGGELALGYGLGRGPGKAAAALEDLRQSPLLEHGQLLREAGGLLVSITGGMDLAYAEVQKALDELTGALPPHAPRFIGTAVDPAFDGVMRIMALVAGAHETPAPAPAAPAGAEPAPAAEKTPDKPVRVEQGSLPFDLSGGKGRFNGLHPTYYGAEDLDLPTFRRRGQKLSGAGR